MDVAGYLTRIGFKGEPQVDLASLAALQRAHLQTVPFENLHVYHRRGVRVDTDWSIPKIMSGRGGWCFELNGAFAELLLAIGFRVDRVSALVLLGEQLPDGPDHLALVVHLDKRYLVDVGFGASLSKPIDVDSNEVTEEDHGSYRIAPLEDDFLVLEFRGMDEQTWSAQYRFDLRPVELSAFVVRSRYLETEPGLPWTNSPFATRLVPGGRVTLLKDRLKLFIGGETAETPVPEEEWSAVLKEWFGMTP